MAQVTNNKKFPDKQTRENILTCNLNFPDYTEYVVFCDASLKENNIGFGWLILKPNGELICYGSNSIEGDYTTNQAEVLSIKYAWEQIESLNWHSKNITFFLDNKSIVDSFNRETRIHRFKPFQKIKDKIQSKDIFWFRRQYNNGADILATKAREKIE